MTHLLAELEIDAAVEEFLCAHGAGQRQLIVTHVPPDEPEDEPPSDWDELTARIGKMCAATGVETLQEVAERLLGRMGI